MVRRTPNPRTPENAEKLRLDLVKAAESGRDSAVKKGLAKLLRVQARQPAAALALLRFVDDGHLPIERSLEILRKIYEAHHDDAMLLGLLGDALQEARDIDMLNASPPDDPLFEKVVAALRTFTKKSLAPDAARRVHRGLASAARMMARQHDRIVEKSARRLTELEPADSGHHYNLGLFFKTRGRFREGMLANQAAIRLSETSSEAAEWNLGICATGARDGATAFKVWKRMKQKIAMGRFDLPEGRYPQCKVRLAQRPLAERTIRNDSPGLEETIWIERLSPCHGIIRSVLFQDLGVDYGDVILFDGAPITYHQYGEESVPVFPHLATLLKCNYQFFDFAGTQAESGHLGNVSEHLQEDAIVYSHSENFRFLCADCWRNPKTNHDHDESETTGVVTGRIAAPPGYSPKQLLNDLDAAVAKRSGSSLYAPDLCRSAGFVKRANSDRREFDMLTSEQPPTRRANRRHR